jgi:FHA domain
MDNLLPVFEVTGPDGQQFQVELTKDRLTIGRFAQFNDVALEPDPQQRVTRKVHCAVERTIDGWWVLDNGSVNRTFVRRGEVVEEVRGRAILTEGDSIRILGKLTEHGEPLYWELTLRDPLRTRPVVLTPTDVYLEYDRVQARLFRVGGLNRQEIRDLRPQEHKLIRYMDQRNQANGGVAVLCSYEELLLAIWGDEPGHTEPEVNHLVWELRKKLGPVSKESQFLEMVRGLGYRLVMRH